MATADGDVGHHESRVLARLIDSLPVPQRIDANYSDDEEEWFSRIDGRDDASRAALMSVLSHFVSADGQLNTPEHRFLRRVARALGREIDLLQLESSMERLRRGQPPSATSDSVANPFPTPFLEQASSLFHLGQRLAADEPCAPAAKMTATVLSWRALYDTGANLGRD